MTCYFSPDNWLTVAWNTLAFTKFWKSGLAKYVCANSVLFKHPGNNADDVIIEGCQYYLIVTILN